MRRQRKTARATSRFASGPRTGARSQIDSQRRSGIVRMPAAPDSAARPANAVGERNLRRGARPRLVPDASMIGRVGSGAIGGRAGGDGMTPGAWRDELMIPRRSGATRGGARTAHRTPAESPGEEDGGPAATRGGTRRTNARGRPKPTRPRPHSDAGDVLAAAKAHER
jgi:hypothetical protein